MLLAHSADKKRDIAEQSYADHINGVVSIACQAALEAAVYSTENGDLLKNVINIAAEYHDLGKLDCENQQVLSGKVKAKSLPVQHTDAGTAYLMNELGAIISAVLVRSHHIGLPDFVEEHKNEDSLFRDQSVIERVNKTLQDLVRMHKQTINSEQTDFDQFITGNAQLFFRIALSCLVDGDHTNTAVHYKDEMLNTSKIELQPQKRLDALNRYVDQLKSDDERSRLRTLVYETCCNTVNDKNIISCDSPVGTGKTTAVMAHLLSQAAKRKLRRIIIVLPFTNIITQSVEVYRKALVLPGENPESVVAELHHRADFQDLYSRQFTALWRAPIIVTTAVSFFETIASCTPSSLRRLHNLPGSAIFIDESHAALPAKLLPIAWHWIKGLAHEWGCYWVLASGSLNRFWEIEEFDEEKPNIPALIKCNLHDKLAMYENARVEYKSIEKRFSAEELVRWVGCLNGPRLVILNTVQSAAVVAKKIEQLYGRNAVEHISTALTPLDRAKTIETVKKRLKDPDDQNWTLVATSCVEAGVDFSFRTGVREAASLVSLLQTAGRVNRHGFYDGAVVWTILLKEDSLLKAHPMLKDSINVLLGLLRSNVSVNPDLCTDALRREIRLKGNFVNEILQAESVQKFPEVERNFKVINSDTRMVVVAQSIIERIENYQTVSWQEIQRGSVQIWGYKLDELRIPQFENHKELFKWNLAYDNFLGYMAGILHKEEFLENGITII